MGAAAEVAAVGPAPPARRAGAPQGHADRVEREPRRQAAGRRNGGGLGTDEAGTDLPEYNPPASAAQSAGRCGTVAGPRAAAPGGSPVPGQAVRQCAEEQGGPRVDGRLVDAPGDAAGPRRAAGAIPGDASAALDRGTPGPAGAGGASCAGAGGACRGEAQPWGAGDAEEPREGCQPAAP